MNKNWKGLFMIDVTHSGGGGSAKRWCYSISILYNVWQGGREESKISKYGWCHLWTDHSVLKRVKNIRKKISPKDPRANKKTVRAESWPVCPCRKLAIAWIIFPVNENNFKIIGLINIFFKKLWYLYLRQSWEC